MTLPERFPRLRRPGARVVRAILALVQCGGVPQCIIGRRSTDRPLNVEQQGENMKTSRGLALSLSMLVAGCGLVLSGSAMARDNDDHPPTSAHRAAPRHQPPAHHNRSRDRSRNRIRMPTNNIDNH